ncbi:formylglycine-generating enzyme family protein [Treponema succinifaciens]|uniref:formylglycine-generating enzyme family protein n=1 Tax=Treponema succinifaciens TaxID=167 RepID=UPI00235221CD|nr:SUMF1/EgtB/PvdO family nonheme iron enzyme [Treponema succinifaciens]
MKSLKKCFGLGVGRKSGLSFAMLAGGSLALLLCVSCASGKAVEQIDIEDEERGINMVQIPGESYCIMDTEVTQEIYESVMGENPSNFKGEKNLPVENVSWYDAASFCNKLSEQEGLEPVYSVDGEADLGQWSWNFPDERMECNEVANGYRLPTVEEWQYAANGGQAFKYSGSDVLEEVGWYGSVRDKTHPVAQKKANGYGLYDMSGNVCEWCWDSEGSVYTGSYGHSYCGGAWSFDSNRCTVDHKDYNYAGYKSVFLGFRVVRNADE